MSITETSGPAPSEFVTAEEIAKALGLCAKTVRRRALRGTYPAPVVRTANTALWRRSDVSHLLAGNAK
jgi:hypothetical protein